MCVCTSRRTDTMRRLQTMKIERVVLRAFERENSFWCALVVGFDFVVENQSASFFFPLQKKSVRK